MEHTRVTLRDIAKKLNVSHATVSLALRNHPRISKLVREKIHQAAQDMGYRPDPMLVALSHYRLAKLDSSVGAAIAWINSWPSPSQLRSYKEVDACWTGASSCAEKFGYHLEEFALSSSLSAKRLETILSTRNISGIILPPAQEGVEQALHDFNWDPFSFVRIGHSWTSLAGHVVTSDQFQSTVLAYNKAMEYGYKRIGFIGLRSGLHQFVGGYLFAQSQNEALKQFKPYYTNTQDLDDQGRIMKWIQKNRFDALITEDALIPGILQKNGLKVPDDLALAGLSVLDGHITAGIDQQSAEIGRVAISSVVSLINEHQTGIPPIPLQTLIPGIWVDGSEMPNRNPNRVIAQPSDRK